LNLKLSNYNKLILSIRVVIWLMLL